MHEPSPRTSRRAIAGTLAALLAGGVGGFLLGRTEPPPPPAVAAPAPPPAVPVAAPPPVEQSLARADLIAIGNAAADAAAAGTALPPETAAAAGKRFELMLPFGCAGPAGEASEAALRWRFDAEAGALRVHVAPVLWPITDWWPEPPAAIEAMEGFWIERPWSTADTCPARVAGGAAGDVSGGAAGSAAAGAQTLGVVQLISRDTPRQVRRDGKPYSVVVRIAPEAAMLARGLRVRLVGRIGRFPDGQPVRCRQPAGPEQRPMCLIAITTDELAIENPVGGEALGVWQTTSDTSANPLAHE